MTWFHVSIIANIALGIVIALFALDRRNWNGKIERQREHLETVVQSFKSVCEVRHNPIDEAISRIEGSLQRLEENVRRDLERIWDALNRMKR